MNRLKWPAILLLCLPLMACTPQAGDAAEEEGPGLNAETFQGLELRGIGPALMSGRISDLVIHPESKSTWYVAVGSGGVWKTVNRGTTWMPIFDHEGSYSIGSVALDPHDPNIVWVGTGENVSGRHVGYGDGVYKSLDGGKNWTNMGLETSEHIGMIIFHPEQPGTVYVASQGPLWSGGGDRGLFKTTDGGETWENVLSAGEYTGVSEVHMDPRNPDVLYAVMHQRLRNVPVVLNGGPESGIHKSTDGGVTWRELTNGLPEGDMGKIGFAISPQNPDVVYATIETTLRKGGFWRSADGGENWEKRSDYLSSGTGPHYYQEIFASPHVFDRVYQMDVVMHVTDDGGKTFVKVPQDHKHGDHHALAFDPDDPLYMLSGTDGGVYETYDDAANWRFINNLPVTQYYKVAVDNDLPFYNVYGGTQDNNSQGGPSRTDNNIGIRNSDWFVTRGGDGHQPATDPSNPDISYAQAQQGFLARFDRKTGENVSVRPQPAAGEPADRWNWDSPILVSPHQPERLYFASQRLWRSDDRGDSWRAVSGDLSRGQDRLTLPVMDRVWSFDSAWDLYAMSVYGSITSVSESPLVEGLLYVGTDDGLVQVSEDGGESWRRVDSLPGVPENFFVNDIKADLHDADTVYVVGDDHKSGDFKPYILKSTDRGRTWKNMSGDMPERHVVWRIVQDHVNPALFFAGTEFGVFFSIDAGRHWVQLKGGVPVISFRDLAIQRRENDLVGATFGRSFYVLDDYTPLRALTAETLQQEATLFEVRKTPWYIQRQPLGANRTKGRGTKGSQGESFYAAPNPPFGAVFTYYLKDKILTARDRRREAEKPIEAEGGDTPYPGWDALRDEAQEDAPAILLTVRNDAGEIVQHVEGPTEAGFHRVAWNLRYPTVKPWEPPETPIGWNVSSGALAPPGTYSVTLSRRVDGELVELAPAQSFEVFSIREPALVGAAPDAATQFMLKTDRLRRSVDGSVKALDEVLQQIAAAKLTLKRSTSDPSLYARTNALEKRARDILERLAGWELQNFMGVRAAVSIQARVSDAATAHGTAYGPTPTHQESLEIAEAEFAEASADLTQLDADYRQLQSDLDAAGVPWTPGRGSPLAR